MTRVKKFLYFISDRELTASAAAFILAITGLLSNFLGVVREGLAGATLGASEQANIFFASFRLPDLIFNLFVLGALSSAFMPIFMDKILSDDRKKTWEYASNILNFLLIISTVFGVLVFIFAPQFTRLILPGMFWNNKNADPVLFSQAVNLTRILILSPLLFTISSIFTGMLQSYKKFIYTSLAPLIYNVAFIVSLLALKYFPGPNAIYYPALGVVIGALLHVLIQYPSLRKTGFSWHPILNLKESSMIKTLRLMAPRSIAIGASQINLLVDTVVGSFFVYGIAVFTYANDIQTLPIVVFGIAISTAIFPFLSESYSKKDKAQFLSSFSWAARRILFFIIPATIGIIVLRAQIIRLIFGTNAATFDWEATYWTSRTLAYFAIGLTAQALIPLLLKAFYALQDTKTPLKIALVVMAINALLSVTLPFLPGLDLKVAGISLAFSIAGIVNALLLFWYLHKKIGAFDRDHKIFDSTFRLVVASLIMGIVAHYSLYFFDFFIDTRKVVGLLLQTLGAISVSCACYFLIAYILKCEEITFVINKFTKLKKLFLPKAKIGNI